MSDDTAQPSRPFDDLRAQREAKMRALRERGVEPFAYRFAATHRASQVAAEFEASEGADGGDLAVAVAGRLTARRTHGKASFGDLSDWTGRIQIYLKKDVVGDETYDLFLNLLDLGDVIGVVGHVMRTRMGEVTIHVTQLTVLAKSLRPLPDNWHGLTDLELRRRYRYLDLLVNEDARRVAELRVRTIRALRTFLDGRGFLEVETPALQPLYGGATARPFTTYHNTLDTTLYLRIADELYLKRLIVGGMERVYEICKDFRNEGMDSLHNPEFTMLELYQAYADYTDMMALAEEMFAAVARDVIGTMVVTRGKHRIDLGRPWGRVTMVEAVGRALGVDAGALDAASLAHAARERGVDIQPGTSWGNVVAETFETLVEHTLEGPLFVLDHPMEISPLAKVNRQDPRLVERFEIFIAGSEMGNAFSEQNDPLAQSAAFDAQIVRAERGDLEAHQRDEDYLRALEHGMPPTGGFGVGVDRLVMLLAGVTSIRDVILFPLLRPRRAGETTEDDLAAESGVGDTGEIVPRPPV
jgi:lysyl-tRNA synthetase class 2